MWWPAPWGGWSWFQDVSRFQLSSLIDRWVSSWWPRLETVCFCLTCAPEAVDGVAPWIRAGRIVDFYAPRLQSAFREVDSMSAESEACKHAVGSWTWSQCMNKISQNMDQRVVRGNCIEIYWRVETCPVGQDIGRIGRTPQKVRPSQVYSDMDGLGAEEVRTELGDFFVSLHCTVLHQVRVLSPLRVTLSHGEVTNPFWTRTCLRWTKYNEVRWNPLNRQRPCWRLLEVHIGLSAHKKLCVCSQIKDKLHNYTSMLCEVHVCSVSNGPRSPSFKLSNVREMSCASASFGFMNFSTFHGKVPHRLRILLEPQGYRTVEGRWGTWAEHFSVSYFLPFRRINSLSSHHL